MNNGVLGFGFGVLGFRALQTKTFLTMVKSFEVRSFEMISSKKFSRISRIISNTLHLESVSHKPGSIRISMT